MTSAHLSGIALAISAALGAIAPASAQELRTEVELRDGWQFHQGDLPAFPDGPLPPEGWSAVSVPHTWNRVGVYIGPPEAHINRAETVNKYQGAGWYRLEFDAPAGNGKRAWLEFDGASRLARVWLNGQLLGQHQGGFSRFRLDATAALKPRGNVLLVRVDNSKPAAGSSTADNLPLAGDFFVHGGLYRPVSLVVTDPVHVDMLDHGGPGVYAATQSIEQGVARIAVLSRLRNDSLRAQPIAARVSLIDRSGAVAAVQEQQVSLPAQGKGEAQVTLTVPAAHLWQGTADPYLYRLRVDLVGRGGAVLDRVEQDFGIRQIRVDPDQGLLLNGKPLRLRGVGYHQDREGKGWAVSADDVAQDFAIMQEMGVNTIRLTHYQHGEAIHRLADKAGFLLWDEIPLVSMWTQGDAKEPTAALRSDAESQLREMIRQNFNHASVAVWSIANEVDFGNSMPMFLSGKMDGSAPPDPMPLLRDLDAVAKREDPTRPTALATCCEGRVFAPGISVPTTAEAADLGGANRYFGWYFGQADDLGPHLDALRAARPAQPLSVTEYGAGGAVTMHTDNVLGGPADSRGRAQPEEYQSYVHERNWQAIAARPWLWASWVWNSFDFATTIRHEGDADDINTKGLVTYDRKVRKDAYYFYKANWTATPTVHIAGRRYADRAYAVTPVRVYSNAARTELLLNGQSLGIRAACPQSTCVWDAVRLAPGANTIVARGLDGAGPVADTVEWRLGPDAARAVRIDSGALVAGKAPGLTFGSDTFFSGGTSGTVDRPADYGKPAEPTEIAGASARAIAATYREGRLAYHVPLARGRYRVVLTFVEPGARPGARRFDVRANGKRVIKALDLAAGAPPLSAVVRSVAVEVKGEALDLEFVPIQGQAIVSSIEIETLRR